MTDIVPSKSYLTPWKRKVKQRKAKKKFGTVSNYRTSWLVGITRIEWWTTLIKNNASKRKNVLPMSVVETCTLYLDFSTLKFEFIFVGKLEFRWKLRFFRWKHDFAWQTQVSLESWIFPGKFDFHWKAPTFVGKPYLRWKALLSLDTSIFVENLDFLLKTPIFESMIGRVTRRIYSQKQSHDRKKMSLFFSPHHNSAHSTKPTRI